MQSHLAQLRTLLLVLAFGVASSQVIGQNYADPAIYLVDSLDVDKISKSDLKLLDSCLTAYNAVDEDTIKLAWINHIVEKIWDDRVWPKYNMWLLIEVERMESTASNDKIVNFLKETKAGCINNIGFLHQSQGKYADAAIEFENSLVIYRELESAEGVANCLNNLGYVNEVQGKIESGLKMYFESLEIREEVQDSFGVANSLNNIGYVFMNQGDDGQALEYFLRSLLIREKLKDSKGVSILLNNIALCYEDQNDYNGALSNFQQSLKIEEDLGNESGMAVALNNIGEVYLKLDSLDKAKDAFVKAIEKLNDLKGDLAKGSAFINMSEYFYIINQADSALFYALEAMRINENAEDRHSYCITLIAYANALTLHGQIRKAKQVSLESITISKKLDFPSTRITALFTLTKIERILGEFESALNHYEQGVTIRENLRNRDVESNLIHQQDAYLYRKERILKDKVFNNEIELQNTRLNNQKIWTVVMVIGLLIVAAFLFVSYRRFLQMKSQRNIIAKQKIETEHARDMLEEANTQITHSINYAKRIQSAVLPPLDALGTFAEKVMVLFKPRDIVSGDFYWFHKVGSKIIMVAADCTGHGVPGALLSMLGVSSLEKIILERGITSPGEILQQLDVNIMSILRQNVNVEGRLGDGMDIGICVIDIKINEFKYAGALRPMYLVRNHNLEVFKGSQYAIGDFVVDQAKKYDEISIPYQAGDELYLTCDGYSDQFGENEKKYYVKKFKKDLIKLQGLEPEEKYFSIMTNLKEHQGSVEQTDDVLVICINL